MVPMVVQSTQYKYSTAQAKTLNANSKQIIGSSSCDVAMETSTLSGHN